MCSPSQPFSKSTKLQVDLFHGLALCSIRIKIRFMSPRRNISLIVPIMDYSIMHVHMLRCPEDIIRQRARPAYNAFLQRALKETAS